MKLLAHQKPVSAKTDGRFFLHSTASSFSWQSGLWLAALLFLLCGGNFLRAEDHSVEQHTTVGPDSIKPWLQDIPLKTRRTGILPEEAELYYQVLAFARDIPPQEISRAAREFRKERWEHSKYRSLPLEQFPVFVDMYQHPELYQGRPVIMHGHLQRSICSPAGKNDFGIEQLCEGWLFTEDSQANPTVILATAFPENFPIGEKTIDRVTVTGYLYRMYTYEARDAGRYAPLLMVNRIDWVPPTEVGAGDYSWIWLIFGACVLAFLAFTLGLFFLVQIQQKKRPVVQKDLPREIFSPQESRSEVKFPGGEKKP